MALHARGWGEGRVGGGAREEGTFKGGGSEEEERKKVNKNTGGKESDRGIEEH